MSCWLVIPAKSVEQAKSRLRPTLGDAARQRLAKGMLRRVLAVGRGVAKIDAVFVLGAAAQGLPGVASLADPGGGLNAALAAARAQALVEGVLRLVIVSGDLPRLTRSDIAALIDDDSRAVIIAPDRHGQGTNALSLPLPEAANFGFHYGADSLAAHSREAARLALPLRMARSASLGLDIDVPEDLELLASRFRPAIPTLPPAARDHVSWARHVG